MTRTAYEVQRDFAVSSGLRSEIIWDSLSSEQADVLKHKIAMLICETDAKSAKMVARQRKQIFDNVWRQRMYTNRTLLSAIIYVLVTPETDTDLALQSTNYSCHPVIRTRKCMREDNSQGCCMVFIDEHGRVYGSWPKYVYNNALPKGTMIAPSHGIYTFGDDEDNNVHLMLQATPASKAKHKILSVGDTVASVGGLVATVPVVATLAVPLAGSVVFAATAVCAAATAYSAVRSASRLYDRRCHEQSTSICDREARNSWLGVAGGVVGLGATGATKVLSTVSARGIEANTAAQLAVKGINVSSIVISGTGVVNGVYDLYLKINDEQPISRLDVLQIASSLVIFTHSVNNLRVASKVTNGSTLRRALRNQTRKVFDQISRETAKLHGQNANKKFDIVRTLNDIPIKEMLLSLHELNSHLRQGATVVGAIGASLLPDIVSIAAGGQMRVNLEALATQFGCKFVEHISNAGSLLDVLDALAVYFSEKAIQLLMELTRSFVEQNVDNLDRTLNTFISTETVLYRMLMHCVNNYKEFTPEFLQCSREDILSQVSKYFQSLHPVATQGCRKHKCAECKGVYYICKL